MPDLPAEVLKLMSVALTREKRLRLEEEFERYARATNYVIKAILKRRLSRTGEIIKALKEPFASEFDKRVWYLRDVVKTARVTIADHKRTAKTVRGMRYRQPFFKQGRMILSQPIVKVGVSALILRMPDRTQLAIPYDKRSRNRESQVLAFMVRGEREERNKKYERVRVTWNKEGFVNIDIRVLLGEMKK
jgi:hypothetical protein